MQGQANYKINYNVTSDYDELAYQLPNLYNGSPDFLHTIDVTYTLAGSPTLEAFRLVKAYPVVGIKDTIVNPPEYDSDGVALRHHPARRREPDAGTAFHDHRGGHGRERNQRGAGLHQRHGHDGARLGLPDGQWLDQGMGLHVVRHRGGQL